jgi:hypothetical protein
MANRSVTIKFLADLKDFVKGTALGGQAAEGMAGKLGGLAGTIGSAYAVGKVVEFGKASVMAAQEDAEAQSLLATTLRNTTGATDDQIASVEDFIAKTQDATGVMDDELRPAFQNLVRVTKDTESAQSLMTLAMDVAVGTGKDLESVSLALAKAHEGSTGKLKALGIETKNADGTARDFADIQQQLTDQFGGSQAAAADTAAGKMRIMQARYADLQETIGAALLPIMSELVGVASSVLDAFSSLDEGTQQWIIRIGMLGGGLVLAARAVKGMSDALGSIKTGLTAVKGLSSGASLAMGALGVAVVSYTLMAKDGADKSNAFANSIKNLSGVADDEIWDAFTQAMYRGILAGKDETEVMDAIAHASLGTAERLRDLSGEHENGARAAELLTAAIDKEIAAQRQAGADTERTAEIVDDAVEPTEDLTVATDDKAEADRSAAAAAEWHNKAIRELFDAIVGVEEGNLRYRDAVRSADEGMGEYIDTVLHLNDKNKDTRTTLVDVAAAMDDQQGRMMDVAEAARTLAEDQARANGVTDTGAIGQKAYRDELVRLAGTLAAGDPLRANLEAYIWSLATVPLDKDTTFTADTLPASAAVHDYDGAVTGVPTSVSTRFSADTTNALTKINGLLSSMSRIPGLSGLGNIPIFAAPAASGEENVWGARWVGENGPEMWVPPMPGGSIIANNRLPKIGSGGATVNNFVFNAPVADKATVVDWVHEGLLRKKRSGSLQLS